METVNYNQCIIYTIHSANLFLMGVILNKLMRNNVAFMLQDVPNKITSSMDPIHHIGINMIIFWQKYQKLIKADLDMARNILNEQFSLIIAGDVPILSENKKTGVVINFFNKKCRFPIGSLKLAYEYNLPLIVLIPFSEKVYSPYKFKIKKILLKGNFQLDMQNIYNFIEKIIRDYPSVWLGWAFWDKLKEKDYE